MIQLTSHNHNPQLDRFVPGLERWANAGIRPGGFLCAVLRNDLKDAAARADNETKSVFFDLITFINVYMPLGSWGSKEAFDSWEGLK